jgi:hypothetical protein
VALGLALGLTACAPSTHATGWQEIVTDVEFLPPPNLDNPVMFGESLHAFPGTRAKLMQAIAFQVSGHLPGTRFLVIRGPVLEPPGGEAAISYRTWGEGRPLAVLGWYPTAVASPFGPPGTIVLPGLWWEVAHIEWGTDDGGRHVPP